MTTFLILVLTVTLLLALARLVRRDGYGAAAPPASHEPWQLGGLPSEPYRARH